MPDITSAYIADLKQALPLWHSNIYSVSGVAQSALWLKHWQQYVNQDCFALALFQNEMPVLLLPLEAIRSRGQMIARFPGGAHANCNFPLLNPKFSGQITKRHLEMLVRQIKSARPDISLLSLTRQMETWLGHSNPLMLLNHQINPNPVLTASLPENFDLVLERSNPARKRKKHRQHSRRYDETGAWRIYTAETPAECTAAFDAFYQMKSQRLASQGIANSFAPHGVYNFFQALFTDDENRHQRQFILHVLEVAEKPRAIIGCSYWLPDSKQKGLTVEFGAFANDELLNASPGDFLFYETIAASIADGLQFYSFGIGEEKYKRDWCDIQLPLYDCYIPLSFPGRILMALTSLRVKAAHTIKNNPALWQMVKKLRQKLRRS